MCFIPNKSVAILFKKGQSRPLFCFYFPPFPITISRIQIAKAQMVCLGIEPAAAGWQAQTIPQSYGSRPQWPFLQTLHNCNKGRVVLRRVLSFDLTGFIKMGRNSIQCTILTHLCCLTEKTCLLAQYLASIKFDGFYLKMFSQS